MIQIITKLLGQSINILGLIAPRKSAYLALRLFSTPQKGRLSESQHKFMSSAKQKSLKVNDLVAMTYHWPGSKDTVLLLHGWESNAARWKLFIKLLRSHDYDIVAIDGPAHGQSSGKRFNALLYADFIKTVTETFRPKIIIGHSVGGMAAVFCLHENNHLKVDKLVLLGSPAHFVGVLERYVDLMGYSNRVHRTIASEIEKKYGHGPEYFSAAEFAQDLNCNTLIIHDKDDAIIPYSDALLYSSNFKNSKLISTEDMGHSLNNKTVHASIIEFMLS
ncbi:MAG: alpha/beta hydrolase [Bacteroidia bacterium]|nr:alpha/beta hydrolase [Bacteroidia bacterium]MBT8287310.1 alpha/beta hydrolase [Bacteroidia bacterium]